VEAVAVAPVDHLGHLDRPAGLVLGQLVAAQERSSRLELEELGETLVRGDRLDREARAGSADPVPLLEDRVERHRREVHLAELRRERERDTGAVDEDRHLVHQAQTLELEQRRPGRQTQRVRLVDRGRPDVLGKDPRPRGEAAGGGHLGEAHQLVRRLADPCAGDDPPSARGPGNEACAFELVQGAAQRDPTDAEVLGERPLRRER
jgi:hypothetical protein